VTENSPSQFHWSQFELWRTNCDEKASVTINCDRIFVTDSLPSQSFCDGHCDGQFRIVTEVVTEIVMAMSVTTLQGGDSTWWCWMEKLWRTGEIVTVSVTICDGIATAVTICDRSRSQLSVIMVNCNRILWPISVTIWFCDGIPLQISSQFFEKEKKFVETFVAFQLTSNVHCPNNCEEDYNRCTQLRFNKQIHTNYNRQLAQQCRGYILISFTNNNC